MSIEAEPEGRSGEELMRLGADIVAAVTEAKPFALVLQYPGTTGEVRDLTATAAPESEHKH